MLDLFILGRVLDMNNTKTASIVTLCWVLLAALFGLGILWYDSQEKALLFATGYVIELALSMDNVFVFILLFSFLQIKQQYQHKILFIGILSAIFMRLGMISGGIYLVTKFQWIFYIFGAFLIYSGLKLITESLSKKEDNESENRFLVSLQKYLPISNNLNTHKFFLKENGKLMMTKVFLAIILIEQSDLIFALDSIPAILAITNDIFIVFTSNIFAILGLRSMYFMLSSVMDKFIYLKHALAFILSYIGCKMVLSVEGVHILISISLGIVLSAFILAILFSVIINRKRD